MEDGKIDERKASGREVRNGDGCWVNNPAMCVINLTQSNGAKYL
jgi:hypothetical protein